MPGPAPECGACPAWLRPHYYQPGHPARAQDDPRDHTAATAVTLGTPTTAAAKDLPDKTICTRTDVWDG